MTLRTVIDGGRWTRAVAVLRGPERVMGLRQVSVVTERVAE